MIQAKELRIGNLVYIFHNRDVTVKNILNEYINIEESIDIFSYHELKPIPITEEWLLKFGFEKETDVCGFKWSKGNFYILQFGKNAFYCDYSLVFAVDHIHQLQNLYFALTQKELTINN